MKVGCRTEQMMRRCACGGYKIASRFLVVDLSYPAASLGQSGPVVGEVFTRRCDCERASADCGVRAVYGRLKLEGTAPARRTDFNTLTPGVIALYSH